MGFFLAVYFDMITSLEVSAVFKIGYAGFWSVFLGWHIQMLYQCELHFCVANIQVSIVNTDIISQ